MTSCKLFHDNFLLSMESSSGEKMLVLKSEIFKTKNWQKYSIKLLFNLGFGLFEYFLIFCLKNSLLACLHPLYLGSRDIHLLDGLYHLHSR